MDALKLQELPDAPHGADGRPIGTRCTTACHRLRVGLSQAHCAVCHSTLRTVSDFDAHRRDGYCLDLEALGLVERDGLWATPEGHAQRAQLRQVRGRGGVTR